MGTFKHEIICEIPRLKGHGAVVNVCGGRTQGGARGARRLQAEETRMEAGTAMTAGTAGMVYDSRPR